MAKRKYTKKSDYWNKFENEESQATMTSDFQPKMMGESIYETQGSSRKSSSSDSRSKSRTNSIATSKVANKYANIDSGLLPFEYSEDNVGVTDAITLCQKAYFNIPVFRSTIDLMSQYSNTEVYLEGGSQKSRKFVEAWFKRIRLHDIQDQFFREFYRSGNVFMLRLDGTLDITSVTKMMEVYGASKKNAKIPIKYIMLNPADIVANGSITFSEYQYFKVLTPFEVARLKKPTSEHEKELYNSMPEEARVSIKNSPAVSNSTPIIPLETEKLHVVFAGKQDYEPMAIPSGFSVLDDLNKKMELKKIDQAIARSIENVVLLVTMGAEPDKGGVNHKALSAMQNIFQNQSVGRVLVSDYTTKAEFVIPDLKKVMGAEKYQVLDQDIKDGLQNILIGDSKYSQGELKMQVFLEKLQLARDLFLKEFLQPEIKRLCKDIGMKNFPKAKMIEVGQNKDDETKKIAIRMMELGVMTPEQGMDLIDTGDFPKSKDLQAAQKTFKQSREDGHYLPLVNSINLYQQDGDINDKSTDSNTADEGRNNVVKNPSPSGGRPVGVSNSTHYSKANIIEVTKMVTEFEKRAVKEFSKKFDIKRLNKDKKDLVSRVCDSIVVAKESESWDSELSNVLGDLEQMNNLEINSEVLDFGAKHQLDDLSAAILYHSTKLID
jgi:hypothetical protein